MRSKISIHLGVKRGSFSINGNHLG